MMKPLMTILIMAAAVCLAPNFSSSETLQASHPHWRGYSSYYGGPYIGSTRYYSGYRGYPRYGWGGTRISIGIGAYPSYYSYGRYRPYPYYNYGAYPSGAYYRAPVIYRSPVIIQGYYGYCR